MKPGASWDYKRKPLIVFWETTKACGLACKHCRAHAIPEPLPDELNYRESLKLVEQVAEFGKPSPILVITGGDPLMKKGLWNIIEHAVGLGIRVAVAPSVTPLLTRDVIKRFKKMGVARISISIDSGRPEVHDAIRGYPGTLSRSVKVLRWAREEGLPVQVNTVVMKPTVRDLPVTLKLLIEEEVDVWEVFYVIPVGRAQRILDLTPQEWEDVSNYLYDASRYGVLVRAVEGPMFRRVALTRRLLEVYGGGYKKPPATAGLYEDLMEETVKLLGEPTGEPKAQTTGTRDGKGVIFVAHNGDVYPSGFLPVKLGNVREARLKEIYTESPLLKAIQRAEFKGRCGKCEFKDLCGGSRARAYSYTGDPLEEDPACMYQPGGFTELLDKLGLHGRSVYDIVRELGRGRIL